MCGDTLVCVTDLTFSVVHVAEVVERPALPHPVLVLAADLEVAPAADDRLLELAHHLQRVAEVAAGLGLAQPVAHAAGEGEVVLVVLHRLDIVAQVEVRVAQLTVDGAQSSKIVRPCLESGLKKGDTVSTFSRLAELLALEREL